MSVETIIALSPVVIVLSVLITLIMLYKYPDIAIAMSYVVGYILIALFMYFFYRKSKEEGAKRRYLVRLLISCLKAPAVFFTHVKR
jgi:peptidoglycan biosynthesis protein MviN/MurJ (putative lipid II flippase)